MLLALLLVLDYLVLPQVAGTEKALLLLDRINPWLVLLGVTLEAGSLGSYSLLTRSVLPDNQARFSRLLGADLTGLGVSHLLPGGAATATTLRYRLLHEGGASIEDAVVGIALQAVLTTVVLAGMLWAALVVSIPVYGPDPFYVSAALVGAVLLMGLGLALLGHGQGAHGRPTADVVHRLIARSPRKVRSRLQRAFGLAAEQLRRLLNNRHALRTSALWASASWALDAASLWVFLAAFGHQVNPVGLFVAYGLANLAATLPISPGGLGIIEGVLIPSLIGFGTPHVVAVLGVVSWRLFEFWAPIPLSGVSFALLRLRRGPSGHPRVVAGPDVDSGATSG